MEKFLADFTSLHWWLSVVITTFFLNIFSIKIWTLCTTVTAKVSSKWQSRHQKKVDRLNFQIQSLKYEPDLKSYLSTKEIRHRIKSMNLMLMGTFLVLILQFTKEEFHDFVVILVMLTAISSMIAAVAELKKAHRISALLDASDNQEKLDDFTKN